MTNSDVFLAYAPDDEQFALGVVGTALRAAGLEVTDGGSPAPGSTSADLVERLVEHSYVIVIVSPAFVTDPVQTLLTAAATHLTVEEQERRLIPVTYRAVTAPVNLRMRTPVDCTDPDEWGRQLTRLARAIGGRTPTESARPPCPFRGMLPFRANDHDAFFGREEQIDEALDLLGLHGRQLVIGPSGCGKSSFALAGLVPRLTGHRRTLLVVRPSSLLDETAQVRLPLGMGRTPRDFAVFLDEHEADRLVLVVDQLEELFTHRRDEERAAALTAPSRPASSGDLVDALGQLVSSPSCTVIVTMRSDFFDELVRDEQLRELFPTATRYELAPLTSAQLERAITRPALAEDVYVESKLVQAIVDDGASEPGMMPFVQETLVQLWERMEYRLLPLSGYVLEGDLHGRTRLHRALEQHADAAMAELDDDQRDLARRIFLRLIQLGHGRPDTRRRRTEVELENVARDAAAVREVIDHLERARLLTSDHGPAGTRSIDIAHEALLEHWVELRDIVDELRDDLRIRSRLEDQAREWIRLDRRGAWLDRVLLDEAVAWRETARARKLGVDTDIDELITASEQRRRDREAAVEADRRRRLRNRARWIVALAIAALLALAAAVVAVIQRAEAERTADRARSVELATLSSSLSDRSLDRALLLAVEATRFAETSEAVASLRDAVSRAPALVAIRRVHDAEILAIATSGTGVTASGSLDGRIVVWNVDGTMTHVIDDHLDAVRGLAYTPIGDVLVSSSDDGSIRRWDATTGEALGEPSYGHVGDIRRLAIDPTGRQVASAGHDGTVRLWSISTGELEAVVEERASEIVDVAFNVDGSLFASAGLDSVIIVRSTADWRELHRIEMPSSVRAIDFSPTSPTLLAAGLQDWSVNLVDALEEPVITELTGHAERVFEVAFSADGATVASAGRDGHILVHDVDAPRVLHRFEAHAGDVRAVAFDANGHLLSGSRDRTVMEWDPGAVPRLTRAAFNEIRLAGLATGASDALVGIGVRSNQPVVALERAASLTSSIVIDEQPTHVAASSHDGALAVATTSSILFVQADTGALEVVARTEEPTTALSIGDRSRTVAWGTTSAISAVSRDGGRRVVTVDQPIRDLAVHPARATIVAALADGALVGIDASQDPPTPVALADSGSRATAVEFTHDGSTLVVGTSQEAIQLWSITADDVVTLRTSIDHEGTVDDLALDSLGRIAAASSETDSVGLWESDSGRRLGTFATVDPRHVAISALPSQIAVSLQVGATIWDLDLGRTVAAACAIVGRDFDDAEWAFYIGGEPRPTCSDLQ